MATPLQCPCSSCLLLYALRMATRSVCMGIRSVVSSCSLSPPQVDWDTQCLAYKVHILVSCCCRAAVR